MARRQSAIGVGAADHELLTRIFNQFDLDGSGSISFEELGKTLRTIDVNMTEEDVQSLMAQADMDDNAEIDFNEFVLLMQLADPKMAGMVKDIKSQYLDAKAIAAGAEEIIWYSDEMIIARERLKEVPVSACFRRIWAPQLGSVRSLCLSGRRLFRTRSYSCGM